MNTLGRPLCPPWCEVGHAGPGNSAHASSSTRYKTAAGVLAVRIEQGPEDPGPQVVVAETGTAIWVLPSPDTAAVLAEALGMHALAVIIHGYARDLERAERAQ